MDQNNFITPNYYTNQTPQTPQFFQPNYPINPPSKTPLVVSTILAIIFAITSIIFIITTISAQAQVTELQTKNSSLATQLANATTIYFEPTNWGIKFRYPEGVTNIEYEIADNTSDTILVTSISKDGVTYDIDTCGGKSSYTTKEPFYIGLVTNNATIDTANLQQFLALNGAEYYYSTSGSGCKTNSENTDYLISESIFQDLIDNLEI